ncbi:DUF805 domain-containing protein [Notoacmeibacter sp. MSK16QG-6]|uniref:DUF805 domain-containing protein n=1 Tax=Notoacmeibacter sp. MSK16QG-6 TaxID=2957982 RepID=UPI0020A0C98B|nr:DUF805 domain-containing protein [Notoacmeibacter sp. MSK16QG-6]MCP1198727.1 DUF805 domain-containing protein [Notoacmeibacter sp. MSK16QG-6]
MIRNLFRFTGRASRKTFWLTQLFIVAVSIGIGLAVGVFAGVGGVILGGTEPSATAALFGGGLVAIVMIALNVVVFIISLAVSARRFHDLNRSAWWLLGIFVASVVLSVLGYATMASDAGDTTPSALFTILNGLLGLGLIVYLGFIRGTDGMNRYGPDPRVEAF